MCDLISRSALLDDMKKELEKAVNSGELQADDCKLLMTSALALKGFVNRQPTVEPVRGEWIAEKEMFRTPFALNYHCSKCGEPNNQTNFCPNCGADMRKESENKWK